MRQKDSLSPIVFKIIVDRIIDDVKNIGENYRMKEEEFRIVYNTVLIAETKDELQPMLENIDLRKEGNDHNKAMQAGIRRLDN